jgi:hypothetical protein
MGMFTKDADGSYNCISVDKGMRYVKYDDIDNYMSAINSEFNL